MSHRQRKQKPVSQFKMFMGLLVFLAAAVAVVMTLIGLNIVV